VFLATFKITKLLQFNRKIKMLSRMLGYAAWPILRYTVMFILYFVAFIFLAHLWFEQKLYTFSTVYLTVSIFGTTLFFIRTSKF